MIDAKDVVVIHQMLDHDDNTGAKCRIHLDGMGHDCCHACNLIAATAEVIGSGNLADIRACLDKLRTL